MTDAREYGRAVGASTEFNRLASRRAAEDKIEELRLSLCLCVSA